MIYEGSCDTEDRSNDAENSEQAAPLDICGGYYGLIIVDYHVKFQWKAIGLFTDLTNVVIFLAFGWDLHRHLFESSWPLQSRFEGPHALNSVQVLLLQIYPAYLFLVPQVTLMEALFFGVHWFACSALTGEIVSSRSKLCKWDVSFHMQKWACIWPIHTGKRFPQRSGV